MITELINVIHLFDKTSTQNYLGLSLKLQNINDLLTYVLLVGIVLIRIFYNIQNINLKVWLKHNMQDMQESLLMHIFVLVFVYFWWDKNVLGNFSDGQSFIQKRTH